LPGGEWLPLAVPRVSVQRRGNCLQKGGATTGVAIATSAVAARNIKESMKLGRLRKTGRPLRKDVCSSVGPTVRGRFGSVRQHARSPAQRLSARAHSCLQLCGGLEVLLLPIAGRQATRVHSEDVRRAQC